MEDFDRELLIDLLKERYAIEHYSGYIIKKVQMAYTRKNDAVQIDIEIFLDVIHEGELKENPPFYVYADDYKKRLREKKLKELGV